MSQTELGRRIQVSGTISFIINEKCLGKVIIPCFGRMDI